MKKFSIIIPCYNSYKKMEKCLEMLEKQTFNDFELIIVDDCSKDDSFKLLNEYKEKSNMCIKLLKNNENRGAGYTRNVGIQNSSGEYLLFIDSDDFISSDTLEIAFLNLNNNKVDCFVFDYLKCGKNKQKIVDMIPNEQHGFVDRDIVFKYIKGCTCGKIYKRNIIIDNNILFSDSIRNEDMPFTKVAVSFCESIYYYKKKPLYFYVMNNESLMHNKALLNENYALQSFNIVKNKCNKELKEQLEIVFIKECLYSMLSSMIAKKYKKRIIEEKLQEISSTYSNWFKNSELYKLGKVVNIILLMYRKSFFIPIRFIFFLKGVLYD